MSTFVVACVQNCAGDDQPANLIVVERLVREAVARSADLICLPEFFCVLERGDGGYFARGHVQAEHPALAAMQALARDTARWLLLGSIPIKSDAGRVLNRSFVVRPDGSIAATYDKIHLFDVAIGDGQNYRESASVIAGSRAAVTDLPWGRLGLSVCYDVRFPRLYHHLAQAGAVFLSIPAAFTAKTGAAHWHTLVRARAIETGCYVFAPAQCGTRHWGRQTYGHSLIVDPWGEVVADGGDDEGVIVASVDVARVAATRRMIPALAHTREFEPAGEVQ